MRIASTYIGHCKERGRRDGVSYNCAQKISLHANDFIYDFTVVHCERVGLGMMVCEFSLGELSKLKLSVMIYNLQDCLSLTLHISMYTTRTSVSAFWHSFLSYKPHSSLVYRVSDSKSK